MGLRVDLACWLLVCGEYFGVMDNLTGWGVVVLGWFWIQLVERYTLEYGEEYERGYEVDGSLFCGTGDQVTSGYICLCLGADCQDLEDMKSFY